MSAYDLRTDAPGLLRQESLTITLSFERTSDTTGRVSWNVPVPAAGCAAGTRAYDGMVVTLDTTAADSSKLPINGTVYESDATADTNLFAGDRIGTSLVVAAVYGDVTTSFADVIGLKPNTPYYVTGFPVDAQYRYYASGVHAYSLNYKRDREPSQSSTQVVAMTKHDGTRGVSPQDVTGLSTATEYGFTLTLGTGDGVASPRTPPRPGHCLRSPKTYDIVIDGSSAQTFGELVDAITVEFNRASAEIQSTVAPNVGTFYWNGSDLYQWTESALVKQRTFVQPTSPSQVSDGTYWFDEAASALKVRSGDAWTDIAYVTYSTDPAHPLCDKSYWMDGDTVRVWNGTSWGAVRTYLQSSDPAGIPEIPCGSYWYNQQTSDVYKWDDVLDMWVTAPSVISSVNPHELPTDTLWFNTTSNKMYSYNAPMDSWNVAAAVRVTMAEPSLPAIDTYWVNVRSRVVRQWNGTSWNDVVSCIFDDADPRNREINSVWIDTAAMQAKVWDTADSNWVASTMLYAQQIDPTTQLTVANGSAWLRDDVLSVYFNGCWRQTEYIKTAVRPQTPAEGTAWFNGTNWFVRQSSEWAPISPTSSGDALDALSPGSYWFNTASNTLSMWSGASWIPLMYTTTSPAPETGTKWFDEGMNTLKEWDGSTWVVGTPIATVELDCRGDLLFTDTHTGSDSFIAVNGGLHRPTVAAPIRWSPNGAPLGTMWQGIQVAAQFVPPQSGADAISGDPMYEQHGVGTDSSADERRELANEIRLQLGYPTVAVELTEQQIDLFITQALRFLRQRSGAAYTRGFFFLQIQAETQRYKLSSIPHGYNKIASVLGVYRTTSAFLSSAHGAGIYGQVMVQHLYQMGSFDMLSYHLMSNYIENLEMLFATRITFTWNEQARELHLHNRFPYAERSVMIDCAAERTEQDMLQDRWLRPWIQRYVLGLSRIALADVRGKFSTLPGAGGSISLNAAELRQAGNEDLQACVEDIEMYVADRPEEFGSDTQFILG